MREAGVGEPHRQPQGPDGAGRDLAGGGGRAAGARGDPREEALFAGTSSGAYVLATIQVGRRPGPEATVVTLMADSGLKYVSTDVYRRR